MSDQKPSEEPSKFQWLRKYWEESEETAQKAMPLLHRIRLQLNAWLARIRKVVPGTRLPALQNATKGLPRWSQMKYFSQTLTVREQKIVRVATAVLVLSILVLGIRLYSSHVVALAKAGGEYTEGMVGTPQYINPVLALNNDVDLDLSHLIFQGLFRINEKGEVVPDLAAHDEVSSDGKTYVITLRQNAQWQDNEPITANDVIFTFERIQDADAQSPLLKTFRDVQFEAVNDLTVKITLPQPYAPFLSTLTVGILPQHLWADIPASNTALAEYNVKPIGSGPYMFQSLTKDRQGTIRSYHLVRFEGYQGDRPYIDALNFRFYTTQNDALAALKRHQVEGLSFVTQDAEQEVIKDDAIIQQLRLPQYTAVFFNQRNDLLKDKLIRQTLERAISREGIIKDALHGAGVPIYTPILPGFLGFNDTIQGLAYDPDAAKKALDNAGWSWLAGDSVRKKSSKELRFTLTTVDRPEYVKTAQILRDAWAGIGVGVDIRLFSSNDIIKKVIKPRDYEALLFGEIIGTDPDPYPFWDSSQAADPGLNLAMYANKQVDQLLEEARQTNDPEQRRLMYLHFQNILADDEPAIFLYNPYYLYVLPKKVKGFTLQRITYPADRFNDIEKWYIKTKRGWK